MRRSCVLGSPTLDDAADVNGVASEMDTAAQHVDVGDVQPGQLTPPQTAVREDQDDDALVGSGLDGVPSPASTSASTARRNPQTSSSSTNFCN